SAEGFAHRNIRHDDYVDLRYKGQSYELTVPFTSNFVSQFYKLHERRYGYGDSSKPVELVNVRSTFTGRASKPRFHKQPATRSTAKPVEVQSVWLDGKRRRTAIYDRALLRHGHRIEGPAVIGEYSSTTLIPPGFVCTVDAYLNLVIE